MDARVSGLPVEQGYASGHIRSLATPGAPRIWGSERAAPSPGRTVPRRIHCKTEVKPTHTISQQWLPGPKTRPTGALALWQDRSEHKFPKPASDASDCKRAAASRGRANGASGWDWRSSASATTGEHRRPSTRHGHPRHDNRPVFCRRARSIARRPRSSRCITDCPLCTSSCTVSAASLTSCTLPSRS